VTDPPALRHSPQMLGVASVSRSDATTASPSSEAEAVVSTPSFEALYDRYLPYVWRSVQHLGVPASAADDVVQEIFIVVHGKLAGFEGRSSLKTWLYGITLRVARNHRAKSRRRKQDTTDEVDDASAPDNTRPDRRAEDAEAARIVHQILDTMDDEQRDTFVLAELEELSAPEIAEVYGAKVNTVYSRLRLARAAFAEAAARIRAREQWRTR
jgi:RNA polymerase sigma-70 factor (ECF subfamily)